MLTTRAINTPFGISQPKFDKHMPDSLYFSSLKPDGLYAN